MILQKWNPDTHIYEPFNSPAKKTVLFSHDMEALVDCAECWKEIQFWVCFTSRQIHNDMWFWYPVCWECYPKERK